MIELLALLGVLTALIGFGALLLVGWETLALVALWLIGVGLMVGVPTGVLYHIGLARALGRRGLLPRGWYWRPIELNALLEPPERSRVLTWCYLGATGFVVIAAGAVCLAAALVSGYARGF